MIDLLIVDKRIDVMDSEDIPVMVPLIITRRQAGVLLMMLGSHITDWEILRSAHPEENEVIRKSHDQYIDSMKVLAMKIIDLINNISIEL